MSKLDGFYACAPLSATCVLDWSAIATAFAGLVALWVGVMPMLRARAELAQQAKYVGKIVAGSLALHELNLLVIGKVAERENYFLNHWIDEEIGKLLNQVSSNEPMQLIPYIRVVPKSVADSLVNCIGMLQSCERKAATRSRTIPYEVRRVFGEVSWFAELAVSVQDLRFKLCEWTGADIDDVPAAVRETAQAVIDDSNDQMTRHQRNNPPSAAGG